MLMMDIEEQTIGGELESWLRAHREQPETRLAAVGDVIGSWRLVAFLAQGGHGEVWRVVRVDGQQNGVMKILRDNTPKGRRRQEFAAGFLSRSKSGRFPCLLDKEILEERSYLVLEELNPVSLPRRDADVARFVLTVAGAVGELHAEGYVHRDVKPGNLMTRDGVTPVLIDLGLLKEAVDADGKPPVSSVSIVDGKVIAAGTPGYAAPEQLTGGEISFSSDIHALGVLANECFEGRPPRAWEPIIHRCTSSLPNRRFRTVGEFARAVGRRHRQRLFLRTALVGLAAVALAVIWLPTLRIVPPEEADGVRGIPSEVPACIRAATAEELQAALRTAPSGAEILVEPGEYRGDFALEGRPVRLVSAAGEGQTFLIGSGSNSVLRILPGADGSLVRGFTIKGGRGHPSPSSYGFDYYGGGVKASVSARLEDCVVTGNGQGTSRKTSATFGGGVFVENATVTLVNCLVSNNLAWASGGGLMASGKNAAAVLERCTVQDNASTDFFGNQAGVSVSHEAALSLDRCRIEGNKGDQVGAFGGPYARGTRAEVKDCFVEGGARACNIGLFIASPDTGSITRESVGYHPLSR